MFTIFFDHIPKKEDHKNENKNRNRITKNIFHYFKNNQLPYI